MLFVTLIPDDELKGFYFIHFLIFWGVIYQVGGLASAKIDVIAVQFCRLGNMSLFVFQFLIFYI